MQVLNGNWAGACTMTYAAPGVITTKDSAGNAAYHGLVANNMVKFATTGALPSNLTAGTLYYVISTGLTASTFQVSATKGGTGIDTSSGSPSGTFSVSSILVAPNVNVRLSGTGREIITESKNRDIEFVIRPGEVLSSSVGTCCTILTSAINSAALDIRPYEALPASQVVFGDNQTVTFTTGSTTSVALTGHLVLANAPVKFSSTVGLPGNLVTGTTYYAKTITNANAFTLSSSSGGADFATSSAGSGTMSMQRGLQVTENTDYGAGFATDTGFKRRTFLLSQLGA